METAWLTLLCVLLLCRAAAAQQPGSTPAAQSGAKPSSPLMPDLTKTQGWFPNVLKPYLSQSLPKLDLNNTAAVSQMVHDQKLHLSIAQLVRAVMQNNLDIQSSRYYRYIAQTDILRAKAGGALRGSAVVHVPSGLFAGPLGAGLIGQLGVSSANGPAISGSSARVSSFSPRGTFDPNINLVASVDRSDAPLSTLKVAGVTDVITNTATLQTRYSQAFTSGTSFSVSFNTQRTSTNQRFLRFNPAYTPRFSFAVVQHLLNGFGFAVNRRFIAVAKNERQIAREAFRQQVITTMAKAEDSYWDLVAFQESERAAKQALQVAEQLYQDNKKQAQVGTLAPLDVISAESEVAARQRDLIVAQTNVQQAALQLKTLFSRKLDPRLASAPIVATDPLPEPKEADIPKLADALATAQKNRPELFQQEGNVLNETVAEKFAKNALKPTVDVFGLYSTSSLYGNALINDPVTGVAIASVPGGLGPALTQLAQADYPNYIFGISVTIPLRNRSAQADNVRTALEERQAETDLQRTRNQVALEVRNAVIGLVQAKSQVEASEKAVQYEKQTLDAEQKKLAAGTSTPYNVILVQRDLLSAELAEVQARATYAKARVEMDRSTGTILEKNHISPAQVPRGKFPAS